MAEELSYSISISGHNDDPLEEMAEEGRKFVKALNGVSSATLYGSRDGKGVQIDLTKPQADVAAQATEGGA